MEKRVIVENENALISAEVNVEEHTPKLFADEKGFGR